MAELIYAALCQRVLIDQATNFVSYIDILDGVNVPKLPFAVPPSMVGTIWRVEGENRLEMRVRVADPDSQLLAEAIANPLELKPTHLRGRMNVRVPGFEAAKPGTYRVGIELRRDGSWENRRELLFQVNLSETSPKIETVPALPAKKPSRRIR